jgi:carboxyl-terminal processing protease
MVSRRWEGVAFTSLLLAAVVAYAADADNVMEQGLRKELGLGVVVDRAGAKKLYEVAPRQPSAASTDVARQAEAILKRDGWWAAACAMKAGALANSDAALEDVANAFAREAFRLDVRREAADAKASSVREEVQRLSDKGDNDAALVAAAKGAVPQANWGKDLITRWEAMATDRAHQGRYASAARAYRLLSRVEPGERIWQERLQDVRRRGWWMLAYAPAEFARREGIAGPLAVPADPATRYRGASIDMVYNAAYDAATGYYRPVDYGKLAADGLGALRDLVTTPGMSGSFAGVADEERRAEFLRWVDHAIDETRSWNDTGREKMWLLLVALDKCNGRTVRLPNEVWLGEFGDAMAAGLDPWTRMIWPTEYRRLATGEVVGIGVELAVVDRDEVEVRPIPGLPADRAGVRRGEVLVAVDGKTVASFGMSEAVLPLMTGPTGSTVRLTLRGTDGTTRVVAVQRAEIKPDAKASRSVLGWGDGDAFVAGPQVGYVRVRHFGKDTSADLASALAAVQGTGARSLVLDLRGNTGGLLTAAVSAADQFVGSGTIVAVRPTRATPNPPMSTEADPACAAGLTIVVLTDEWTASGAEIVADVLRRRAGARVVGCRTAGVGSVTMLYPLAKRQALLKLTTGAFYSGGDRLITRQEGNDDWGVRPDVEVGADAASLAAPPENDDQLTAAILVARLAAIEGK